MIFLARLQKLLNSLWRSGLAVPILIIALGIVPASWAPWDVILISEDLALPRTPQQFFLTLHSWNPILNTGTPYNVAHTAILTFAQQAGLQAIGFGPAVTQRLIMIVWMTLPGLGMYVLVRTLFASRLSRRQWQTAAAVAASFYMFNLYIEHAWRGFNIGVLSAQAALPLLLTLLYLGFKGRISAIRLALYTVPVALWSSGVGVLLHDLHVVPAPVGMGRAFPLVANKPFGPVERSIVMPLHLREGVNIPLRVSLGFI